MATKPQVAPLTREEMAAVNDAAEKAQESQQATRGPTAPNPQNRDLSTPPKSVLEARAAQETLIGTFPQAAQVAADLHHLLLIVYAGLITLMDRARVSREEFHAAYAVALESAGKLQPSERPVDERIQDPSSSGDYAKADKGEGPVLG